KGGIDMEALVRDLHEVWRSVKLTPHHDISLTTDAGVGGVQQIGDLLQGIVGDLRVGVLRQNLKRVGPEASPVQVSARHRSRRWPNGDAVSCPEHPYPDGGIQSQGGLDVVDQLIEEIHFNRPRTARRAASSQSRLCLDLALSNHKPPAFGFLFFEKLYCGL